MKLFGRPKVRELNEWIAMIYAGFAILSSCSFNPHSLGNRPLTYVDYDFNGLVSRTERFGYRTECSVTSDLVGLIFFPSTCGLHEPPARRPVGSKLLPNTKAASRNLWASFFDLFASVRLASASN
jgi:hypothetical protein